MMMMILQHYSSQSLLNWLTFCGHKTQAKSSSMGCFMRLLDDQDQTSYRVNALPDAKLTVSKHQRNNKQNRFIKEYTLLKNQPQYKYLLI